MQTLTWTPLAGGQCGSLDSGPKSWVRSLRMTLTLSDSTTSTKWWGNPLRQYACSSPTGVAIPGEYLSPPAELTIGDDDDWEIAAGVILLDDEPDTSSYPMGVLRGRETAAPIDWTNEKLAGVLRLGELVPVDSVGNPLS